MRIAYICADPGIPVFGRKGCSMHVQEVIRALLGRGERVELFACRFDGDTPSGLSDVIVHKLPKPEGVDSAQRERAALGANEQLRCMLASQGQFDLIYERYSVWSYAAMDHAAASGIAGLLEVNAPLIEEQAAHRALIDRGTAAQVAERVFNAAASVLAVSEQVASYVCRFMRDPLRVHVVPNGVDPSRFAANVRASRPAQTGLFTIGFVGNMRPWHGLPLLVEVFHQLYKRNPKVRLMLVGGGPEQAQVHNDLSQRGLLDATVMTGSVDRDAIPGLLASMDVAVALYPAGADFYFSPLKIFEYMAAGLPMVASAIGQIAQVIEHEKTGLLVPPGDTIAMADAIERLKNDAPLRRRLGRAARQFVLQHHTWEQVAERIIQLAQHPRCGTPCPERIGC